MCATCGSAPVGTNMRFDQAFAAMCEGFRLRRPGWNGRGMCVRLANRHERPPYVKPFLVLEGPEHFGHVSRRTEVEGAPGVMAAVPWVPSQGDLFAEDWEIVK